MVIAEITYNINCLAKFTLCHIANIMRIWIIPNNVRKTILFSQRVVFKIHFIYQYNQILILNIIDLAITSLGVKSFSFSDVQRCFSQNWDFCIIFKRICISCFNNYIEREIFLETSSRLKHEDILRHFNMFEDVSQNWFLLSNSFQQCNIVSNVSNKKI